MAGEAGWLTSMLEATLTRLVTRVWRRLVGRAQRDVLFFLAPRMRDRLPVGWGSWTLVTAFQTTLGRHSALSSGCPKMAALPDDTEKFVARLRRMRDSASTDEERIAADLFSWADEITIARAPGRMDVMGACVRH